MKVPEEDSRLRHHRVKEILFEATLLSGAEREAYLTAACAGDEALRREVESLLAYHDVRGSGGALPGSEERS
jgi:hypothetical protein